MQVQNADPPPKEILSLVKYLKANLRGRGGVLNGHRVDYFKGKSARKALLAETYAHKSRPACEDKEEAEKLLQRCIQHGMFLSCEKSEDKTLQIHATQGSFSDDNYYVWLYEGSQLRQVLGGIGLVLLVMAGVMFPLWPPFLRNGVWYLSVAVLCLLGAFFVLAIVRLVLYVVTLVVARPGIWIFPNLFEDVGVVDSFIPFWAWDAPPPPKKKVGASGTTTTTTAAVAATGSKKNARIVELEDEEEGDEPKDDEDKKDE